MKKCGDLIICFHTRRSFSSNTETCTLKQVNLIPSRYGDLWSGAKKERKGGQGMGVMLRSMQKASMFHEEETRWSVLLVTCLASGGASGGWGEWGVAESEGRVSLLTSRHKRQWQQQQWWRQQHVKHKKINPPHNTCCYLTLLAAAAVSEWLNVKKTMTKPNHQTKEALNVA